MQLNHLIYIIWTITCSQFTVLLLLLFYYYFGFLFFKQKCNWVNGIWNEWCNLETLCWNLRIGRNKACGKVHGFVKTLPWISINGHICKWVYILAHFPTSQHDTVGQMDASGFKTSMAQPLRDSTVCCGISWFSAINDHTASELRTGVNVFDESMKCKAFGWLKFRRTPELGWRRSHPLLLWI